MALGQIEYFLTQLFGDSRYFQVNLKSRNKQGKVEGSLIEPGSLGSPGFRVVVLPIRTGI